MFLVEAQTEQTKPFDFLWQLKVLFHVRWGVFSCNMTLHHQMSLNYTPWTFKLHNLVVCFTFLSFFYSPDVSTCQKTLLHTVPPWARHELDVCSKPFFSDDNEHGGGGGDGRLPAPPPPLLLSLVLFKWRPQSPVTSEKSPSRRRRRWARESEEEERERAAGCGARTVELFFPLLPLRDWSDFFFLFFIFFFFIFIFPSEWVK